MSARSTRASPSVSASPSTSCRRRRPRSRAAPRSTRPTARAAMAPVGRGDGALAAGLDPPPANLADGAALRDVSPLDYFRRISIGTVGTAMPAFEGRLPAEDRWAAALYASILRVPAPRGDVPPVAPRLRHDRQACPTRTCSRALGMSGQSGPEALGQLAAVRTFQADHTGPPSAQVFDAGARAARLGLRPRPYRRSRRERPRLRRVHDVRAGRARRAGQESRPGHRARDGLRLAPDPGRGRRHAGRARRAPPPARCRARERRAQRWATRTRRSTCSCSRSSSCCARASRRS